LSDVINKAIRLLDLGQFNQARALLLPVEKGQAAYSYANGLIALSYVDEGRWTKAYPYAHKSIKSDPNIAIGYYAAGRVEYLRKENRLAIQFLEKALAKQEKDFHLHYLIGKISFEEKIIKKARHHLDRAIWLNENSWQALLLKSRLEKMAGREEYAKTLLNRALTINPDHQVLSLEQGEWAESEGAFEWASIFYEHALGEVPENWVERELIFDSILKKNWWFRQVAFKWRTFFTIGYGNLIFQQWLILFWWIYVKEISELQPIPLLSLITIWTFNLFNLSFWLPRLFGHQYLKWVRAQHEWFAFFDFSFTIQLSATLSILAFVAYTFTGTFLWFGTAIWLNLLGLLTLGILITKYQGYYFYYLVSCFLSASINFIFQFFDLPLVKTSESVMIGVTILPLLGILFLSIIRDTYLPLRHKKISFPKVSTTRLTEKFKALFTSKILGVFILLFALQFCFTK